MSEREASKGWRIADCLTCGKPYGQEEAWIHDCPLCFKESKGYKLLKGDLAFACLQAEVARLQDALAAKEAETAAEDASASSAEVEALKSRVAALEDQNGRLQRLRAQLKDKVQQLEGEVARLRLRVGASSPGTGSGAPLDLLLLRKMLLLCHPDKHKDAQPATEVTQWLLEQKSKLPR
jgi:hypothetical protein